MNKLIFTAAVGAAIGLIVGYGFWYQDSVPQSDSSDARKPLYWVAPMDANYRRDAPGKSPMGMDLVPVYADDDEAVDNPGAVRISPDVENNLGVRTARAALRSPHNEITTVGYVQYDEERLVHVHPRIEGWVEKLYIKAAGDPVKAGQPLYELYSPQLVNAQEEMVNALRRGDASLLRAAENRLLSLQIDRQFIDKLKSEGRVSQWVVFRAPLSGVVDNLNIREGFFVQPGTTLMSVANLDVVWVSAEVFERQAALVKVGQTVTMTPDYLPGERWQGEVDYVYPTLDPVTRTARVRMRFANPDHVLKPNMFAQVEIHADAQQRRLMIPREALIRTGQQDRVVLALGEGRFKSIAVRVGRMDSQYVEVIDGLEEGDAVVTSAQFLLDSESSKTSDFQRMHHDQDEPVAQWVAGQIRSVNPDERTVEAFHQAIDAWSWPPMTMTFALADTLDISLLEEGVELHMEISKTEAGGYQISAVHIQGGATSNVQSAEVEGVVESIDIARRQLLIARGPIEKWNRPAATVEFVAAPELDISELVVGDGVDFRFEIRADDFVVTQLTKKHSGGQHHD